MKIAEFKAKEVSDYFFDVPTKRKADEARERENNISMFDKMTRGKYEKRC